MILIKLGGSIITDKTQYKTFRKDTVARLCKEIKDSKADTMIIHGAGSFGHVLAKKYSLQKGFTYPDQVMAAAKVQYDVRELNSMIIKELLNEDIPAVSVPPGSCFIMENGKIIVDNTEAIESLADMGIMPVMFGDVVMDREKGFGICSGDQLMEIMSSLFEPTAVAFVSDIDGLYDKDPKTHPDAKIIEEATLGRLKSIDSDCNVDDITGGVRSKMESMLRMSTTDRDCVLLNGSVPGRLYSFLKGKEITCTTAKGGLK